MTVIKKKFKYPIIDFVFQLPGPSSSLILFFSWNTPKLTSSLIFLFFLNTWNWLFFDFDFIQIPGKLQLLEKSKTRPTPGFYPGTSVGVLVVYPGQIGVKLGKVLTPNPLTISPVLTVIEPELIWSQATNPTDKLEHHSPLTHSAACWTSPTTIEATYWWSY